MRNARARRRIAPSLPSALVGLRCCLWFFNFFFLLDLRIFLVFFLLLTLFEELLVFVIFTSELGHFGEARPERQSGQSAPRLHDSQPLELARCCRCGRCAGGRKMPEFDTARRRAHHERQVTARFDFLSFGWSRYGLNSDAIAVVFQPAHFLDALLLCVHPEDTQQALAITHQDLGLSEEDGSIHGDLHEARRRRVHESHRCSTPRNVCDRNCGRGQTT
mmetsp:Transcript_40795/g.87599  ORF Transcript_40795/g.87599 Transcript_40795/m.87599 type:complete len:219 (-) Transcript_40795:645-1301(-)